MNLIRLILTFILPFFFLSNGFAQKKFTLNGTIKDKKNGEQLTGATVAIKELSGTGAVANEYGYYSLTLIQGNYTVISSFIGYEADTVRINLNQDLKIDITLSDNAVQLQEVVVTSRRKNENISSVQSGMEKINPKEINKIPVLFGEKDLLKTIQLMPGVKSAGEGNSGFFVRGGSDDQNLILLDEAPVYNASHLLGFFSTFNSDAIRDATLYKGTQPAQYGGRLSSVLDLKMNEGNNQKYSVGGGIGLISSRLNIEGPIVNDKGSFLITGRRTYADLFLPLSKNETVRNSTLYFYDVNIKANYKVSEKDRIYLSGYFGRDKLGVGESFGIDWGNFTLTLRWNHLINSQIFSNTSLIFSNYDDDITLNSGSDKFGIDSKIQDYNLKQEFQYYVNPKFLIKFGFNSIYHEIVPGKVERSDNSSSSDIFKNRHALENSLFVSNDIKFSEKFNLDIGLRLTSFAILGDGNYYTLDNNLQVIDTLRYKKGELVKNYFNLEPRFSLNYILTPSSSLKAGYFRNVQNLHLISNSTSTNPTDKWIASSNIIKPEISDQISMGWFKNLADNQYEISIETYYKWMQNQIDYKDGADVRTNDAIEAQLLFGKGRAYGIEFFVKKTAGKFTGWAGYTLSRTERLIDGINSNKWYPAKQDRTHDVILVGMYDLSPRLSISASWTYYTGNAVTFPSGKYSMDGSIAWLYTERNGYRMPDYHRLDLGATWKLKDKPKYSSENFIKPV